MQRWEHAWKCLKECQEYQIDKSSVKEQCQEMSLESSQKPNYMYDLCYGQGFGFHSNDDGKPLR